MALTQLASCMFWESEGEAQTTYVGSIDAALSDQADPSSGRVVRRISMCVWCRLHVGIRLSKGVRCRTSWAARGYGRTRGVRSIVVFMRMIPVFGVLFIEIIITVIGVVGERDLAGATVARFMAFQSWT